LNPERDSFVQSKIRNFRTAYLLQMQVEITIPDYFKIKHYKALTHLKSLDEVEQMIHTISVITNTDTGEVMKWSLPSVIDVYKLINEMINQQEQSFHPVIEWDGVLYGYRSMGKMELGEYIDMDNLCKDVDKNLNQILALLYRPITSKKINESKFIYKSTIKAMKYEVENVFDYYDIEEYDPVKRKIEANKFDEFPIDIALGALAFFLDTKAMLLSNSQTYSLKYLETEIKEVMKTLPKRKQRLLNTTAGFSRSMTLLKPISYKSQVILQSQN
jgi:hypothetical protein